MNTQKHAILAASSAYRWLVCTPSAGQGHIRPTMVNVEGLVSTNKAAAEGTTAHKLAEITLKKALGWVNDREYHKELETVKNWPHYSVEMDKHAEEYASYVLNSVKHARTRDTGAIVAIEQRLSYDEYAPEGYGTADAVIVADGIAEVIDFKYGQGLIVSAANNPQLKLYALGLIQSLRGRGLQSVTMTVIQPRRNNNTSTTQSVEDLEEWGRKTVRPQALKAWRGEGDFVTGEHCRFCPIKKECPKRLQEGLDLERYQGRKLDELGVDELADILNRADALESWVKDVKSFAAQAMKNGQDVPGWMLGRTKGRRMYKNEAQIIERLKNEFDLDEIAPRKLIKLSSIEQKLGREGFNEKIGDLIVSSATSEKLMRYEKF